MKIAIYGYYGHQNAGDEAFKIVFKEIFRGHELSFFSPSTLPVYENQFDRLVLGGGNVLGGYFLGDLINKNWNSCPENYAIGVGLSDSAGLEIFKKLNFKKILLRNISEVEKFSGADNVGFVPDLVFSLYQNQNLLPLDFPLPEINSEYKKDKSICFILSLEYFPEFQRDDKFEAYFEFDKSISALSNAIENLRVTYNISLLAISSDPYHYDEIYSRLLYRACPNAWKNVAIINTRGDPEASLSIIKKHDCVISMKYHGLVFGMISDVPIINISQNIKNNDLMTHAELSDYNFNILSESFDNAIFINKVNESMLVKSNISDKVLKYSQEVSAALGDCKVLE